MERRRPSRVVTRRETTGFLQAFFRCFLRRVPRMHGGQKPETLALGCNGAPAPPMPVKGGALGTTGVVGVGIGEKGVGLGDGEPRGVDENGRGASPPPREPRSAPGIRPASGHGATVAGLRGAGAGLATGVVLAAGGVGNGEPTSGGSCGTVGFSTGAGTLTFGREGLRERVRLGVGRAMTSTAIVGPDGTRGSVASPSVSGHRTSRMIPTGPRTRRPSAPRTRRHASPAPGTSTPAGGRGGGGVASSRTRRAAFSAAC